MFAKDRLKQSFLGHFLSEYFIYFLGIIEKLGSVYIYLYIYICLKDTRQYTENQ